MENGPVGADHFKAVGVGLVHDLHRRRGTIESIEARRSGVGRQHTFAAVVALAPHAGFQVVRVGVPLLVDEHHGTRPAVESEGRFAEFIFLKRRQIHDGKTARSDISETPAGLVRPPVAHVERLAAKPDLPVRIGGFDHALSGHRQTRARPRDGGDGLDGPSESAREVSDIAALRAPIVIVVARPDFFGPVAVEKTVSSGPA
ncbi:MAG: hypothetical protein M0D55_08115 [Elusimicrobiota bacterium]|nr:MAG: hypothetical protein M0D55_08115 [Elusimicrobiota bacterium]